MANKEESTAATSGLRSYLRNRIGRSVDLRNRTRNASGHRNWGLLFLQWEDQSETGALANTAFDTDLSTVGFDDVLTRGQTHSRSTLAGFVRAIFGGVVSVKDPS